MKIWEQKRAATKLRPSEGGKMHGPTAGLSEGPRDPLAHTYGDLRGEFAEKDRARDERLRRETVSKAVALRFARIREGIAFRSGRLAAILSHSLVPEERLRAALNAAEGWRRRALDAEAELAIGAPNGVVVFPDGTHRPASLEEGKLWVLLSKAGLL